MTMPAPLFDAQAFDAALAEGQATLPLFRQALREGAAALKQRFLDDEPVAPLVAARAELVDSVLIRAWRHFFADSQALALVAVGGYGRGELHPCSDIDVLILLCDDCDLGAHQDKIEAFLTFLWDIGLEIGHSVRSVSECIREAENDITVATNLLEARLLAGPVALFEQQHEACSPAHIWPSRAFFTAKLQEQLERHRKFNDTAYNLEPNIKENPGGLRDIQMIGWVAKRHFDATTLHDLVGHGFLSEQEYASLQEGQDFLWKIRFGLHILVGRREDRLLFDHQRALARQFGYQDDDSRLAVEHFMKQYYRTVMELNRLNEMLLQLFQEEILYADDTAEPVVLNKRFQTRKGFLEVSYDGVFERYPFALLEAFLLLTQHPEIKGVRAHTARLIREHRYLIDDHFRNDLRTRSLFIEILRQPHGVTHELRRMNRYGILAAYLPVFANIVGQMQHDLFHVYTVDEHTLFVIRNLRRFTVPEFHDEFPLCSELIARVPKPELLTIAGLFHDIAKGRGGDHSELGARDAEQFCREHGLSHYDTRMVSWLVENHLVMSTTAQRKDISDPEVIHGFAERVGDQVHLDYLYLLTVADIRATSPTVWNNWKDALLKDLYHATSRALRRGLENPLVQSERIAEVKQQAQIKLHAAGVAADELNALWDELGDEYFLRYSVDEIIWHSRSILEHDPQDLPLVLIRKETHRGGTEIFVYMHEHAGVFAQITAILAQLGLDVAEARIISSTDGFTLDSFIVLEEDGTPISEGYRIQELLDTLRRELAHPQLIPTEVTRRLPRQIRHFRFPTDVRFSEDQRNQRTIMEVVAYDRPGLLSLVGAAMVACGIGLHTAKIATFGERAEDVFFITDEQGEPIHDSEQLEALRHAVIDQLDDAPAA